MSGPYRLIVAEKPSVARDIARVLGARGRGQGFISGNDVRVTWCVGHLVELAEPAQYDPEWRAWRLEALPMLPEAFKLKTRKSASDQWKVLKELLLDKSVSEVINACDAGREGELIFAYAYEHAGCRAPVKRLWISSMTDEAILGGFDRLRPGQEMDSLRDAAKCRSEADWLVGLNATRAMTTRMRTGPDSALLSIGRVQTPTLALLDEREAAIEAFEPEDFWQIKVVFGVESGTWEAVWTRKGKSRKDDVDRLSDKAEAQAIVDRIKGLDGLVTYVSRKQTRERAPLLYDLTTLQKEANKRFGFTAQETLGHAQALYEKHKVLTYPRTDSRHLTSDQVGGLKQLVDGAAFGPYEQAAHAIAERWPVTLGKRVVDNSEVSDHHAIIPTGTDPRRQRLSVPEKRIYDLVVRRFLAVFMPDAVFATARVETTIGEAQKDVFVARGRTCLDAGWRDIDPPHSKKKELLLPPVEKGDDCTQKKAKLHQGQTKPPKRHTEATLLAAMETAGDQVKEAELKRAMKRSGLGTPATRAAIIETLLARKYVRRDQKNLVPTEQGRTLLRALPVEALRSPRLTGMWEARLSLMAEGQESRAAFMDDVRAFTTTVVKAVRGCDVDAAVQKALAPAPASGPKVGECPLCKGEFREGGRGWGCSECGAYVSNEVARRKVSNRMLSALLKDRLTEPVKGFKSRAGKEFTAQLYLNDAGEIEFRFPDPDPLGSCPACQQPVRRRGVIYTCDAGRKCPFVVFADIGGRATVEADVVALLRGEGALRWDGRRVIALEAREAAGPVGPCRGCGAPVSFVPMAGSSGGGEWRCSRCRFTVAGELGGRVFEPVDVAALLSKGRTPRLHGFRQKNGSVFKAAVVIGEHGRLRWDYSKPDGEDVPAPSGPPHAFDKRVDCPRCVHGAEPHPGYVIAGRAAWGCSRWKAGCSLRVPFEIEGSRLPDDQARRLLSKHHATRWEKDFAGHKRARVVLAADAEPCWRLETK